MGRLCQCSCRQAGIFTRIAPTTTARGTRTCATTFKQPVHLPSHFPHVLLCRRPPPVQTVCDPRLIGTLTWTDQCTTTTVQTRATTAPRGMAWNNTLDRTKKSGNTKEVVRGLPMAKPTSVREAALLSPSPSLVRLGIKYERSMVCLCRLR